MFYTSFEEIIYDLIFNPLGNLWHIALKMISCILWREGGNAKFLLMMILMFTFTGCDSVQETIKDTKRKHSLFQKVIKDNNGLGSKVGLEMGNGILTQVVENTHKLNQIWGRLIFQHIELLINKVWPYVAGTKEPYATIRIWMSSMRCIWTISFFERIWNQGAMSELWWQCI